jgi:polyhydroxybutyrate depolymerase
MKKGSFHLFFISFLLLFLESKSQDHQQIRVDDIQRDYIIYLPKNLPNNAPLVFAFHGYTGNAQDMMTDFGMNEIADKNGFAVCYPQGLIDQKGNSFWQVGYSFHKVQRVNDVKFICSLASVLQKQYKLSKQHTYITGISNGGDLCNMLICKTSGVFKAAAPLLGCIMKVIYDSCGHSKPFPVLLLNGLKDETTYWAGDMKDEQGYGPYLPSKAMFDFHLAKNECTISTKDTLMGNAQIKDDFIVREKHKNNSTANQVWIYTVQNGGHSIPKYINMAGDIWSFFSLYLD